MASYPAAFINVIAEDGSKEEAVEHLQITWDELQAIKRAAMQLGFWSAIEYKLKQDAAKS